MKSLLFLVLFVSFNFCYGQNDSIFIRKNIEPFSDKPVYKTDTIVFDTPNARNILIGNVILPQTSNQQLTKSYGLFFEEFGVKDCSESQDEPKPNKIVEIDRSKEEWGIKAIVYTNCCQDFLADVEVKNDNTLNLIFINYGMYCFCSCPFEITYKFRVMEFDDLKKIKFVSINDEAKTNLE
ncbi:hypothetical protein L3X39_07185 [Sabulilitoribacter multivorans]|uniref:Uncharacterized protein n=1 Tax=Flaviramulus multivorans TaxID=1304750 RepID=A0ABS9II24_9FLAO|nr:hypothetical protein [Flaviramulus multivorans]MCF7560416.1 hypothetical protein [Flaviramulus multivorans]